MTTRSSDQWTNTQTDWGARDAYVSKMVKNNEQEENLSFAEAAKIRHSELGAASLPPVYQVASIICESVQDNGNDDDDDDDDDDDKSHA